MALLPQLTRHLGQPLFLPAHGRGAALPDGLRQLLRRRAGVWDLPELPALGGPLEADGAISDSQRSAAAQMGVARCWYGVNGATGLLQAALLAMVRPGERVLLPRNVHRSLIQACVLGDLRPGRFDLPYQSDRASRHQRIRPGSKGCCRPYPAMAHRSVPRFWCIPPTRAMPMTRRR